MKGTAQDRISKLLAGAARAALALMVVFTLGAFASQFAQAQTFTTLHNFTADLDGELPNGGQAQDQAGNLYGATPAGGLGGYGVVYEVDTAGNETVLHTFAGPPSDGSGPSDILRDSSGNLYGTTGYGGTNNVGVVYKIDTAGNETILHNFADETTDGCVPDQGLIMDNSGNLYGTTVFCGASNKGTVFKLTPNGKEILLHSFAGSPDGAFPELGHLLMDAKGNLYGTAEEGGANGIGTLYKLAPNGKLTVLHSFPAGSEDGCYPHGTPAMDSAGNLYGTTESYPSCLLNEGIVWKVNRKGVETIVHRFTGGASDGAYPYAGVVLDSKGNMYSVTPGGGANNDGIIYQLSKSGKLTVLHSFDNSDGDGPIGEVLRDANGALYGTTYVGGSGKCSYYGCGTVWEYVP